MRAITKLMMERTIFDPNAPRIQDMHATVQHILNLDGRRVLHALRFKLSRL